MRYENVAPADAVRLTIPSSKPFPTTVGRHYCTIADLISWAMRNNIVPYVRNRAGVIGESVARVNEDTVRKVEENLLPLSLGECGVALQPDGTGKLSDFHSRMVGLMRRWWNGIMTEAECKAEACLHIKPQSYHMTDYATINDQSGHTARQKIWNEDMAYGDVIYNQLYPGLTPETQNYLNKNARLGSMISNIIYALHHKKRNSATWNLWDIYQLKSHASKVQGQTAGAFKLNKKDAADLAQAINDWYDFVVTINNMAGLAQSSLKDIFSASFFGLYVVDKLSKSKQMTTKNKMLSTQVLRNLVALSEVTTQALASTREKAQNNCLKIIKLLKKPSKKKSFI